MQHTTKESPCLPPCPGGHVYISYILLLYTRACTYRTRGCWCYRPLCHGNLCYRHLCLCLPLLPLVPPLLILPPLSFAPELESTGPTTVMLFVFFVRAHPGRKDAPALITSAANGPLLMTKCTPSGSVPFQIPLHKTHKPPVSPDPLHTLNYSG